MIMAARIGLTSWSSSIKLPNLTRTLSKGHPCKARCKNSIQSSRSFEGPLSIPTLINWCILCEPNDSLWLNIKDEDINTTYFYVFHDKNSLQFIVVYTKKNLCLSFSLQSNTCSCLYYILFFVEILIKYSLYVFLSRYSCLLSKKLFIDNKIIDEYFFNYNLKL